MRQLSLVDQFIHQCDRALHSLTGLPATSQSPSPADALPDAELDDTQRRHALGLMRVNHTGEVCAQGLYQGQAATAQLTEVRQAMADAATDELDHLAWCESRIRQLGGHTSLLNPLWYGLSFGLGAAAGAISDRVSLGFVAATEEKVSAHLQAHLESLPAADLRSKAVVAQMLADEQRHAQTALDAGGLDFPAPVKGLMAQLAKVMTFTSYRL